MMLLMRLPKRVCAARFTQKVPALRLFITQSAQATLLVKADSGVQVHVHHHFFKCEYLLESKTTACAHRILVPELVLDPSVQRGKFFWEGNKPVEAS